MRKSFFLLVCILTYFVIPLQLKAQEKNSFSLQEAINYALAHNRSVKNADLDIKRAKWRKWEAISAGLPQINGKIEYTNNVLLPDELSATGSEEGPNLLAFIFPKQQIKPAATLTQLIFDGTYLVGLQSAKVFLEISENAKEKTDKEIIKAVTNTYGNVLLNQESLNIVDKNIKSLNLTINETSKLLENGLVEEEDLEQLKITLNNLENNKTRLEQYSDFSKDLLKMLLGIEENKTLTITDSLDLLTKDAIFTPTLTKNFSILNNIDYKIAENNVEAKRLLYKAEQARVLPSIAGFANIGTLGIGQEFGDFYDQQWFTTGTVGLSIDFPIFTSFQGKARRKQTLLDWDKAKNELTDAKIKINLDVKNALADLELAQNTLTNKKDNLSLAERIEKKNNIKYKEGVSTSFELRQAQMQLYSSQNEYLQAMVDLINKKAELESLTK
ncbi:TolC family protein [Wenyingzhuangia sp. IMCC45574]